jgi:hypothetical protein
MSQLYSQKVLRVLEAEGISEEELEHMVTHAAPATNERGNRRFHHWLFSIQSGTGLVMNMSHWEVPKEVHQGSEEMETFDEHEPCEGEGCKGCGWTGEVHVLYRIAPKRK